MRVSTSSQPVPRAGAAVSGRAIRSRSFAAIAGSGPLLYERYRTIAIHGTEDPDIIVVEQEVAGTSSTTGSFVLPNIKVLTTRHGQIAHLRDYANLLAVEQAAGSPVS